MSCFLFRNANKDLRALWYLQAVSVTVMLVLGMFVLVLHAQLADAGLNY